MPSDVRFADLVRLLEQHGWRHKRTKGSHFHFGGPGRAPLAIPVHHGRVKWQYWRLAERTIADYLASQKRSGGQTPGSAV